MKISYSLVVNKRKVKTHDVDGGGAWCLTASRFSDW